MPFVTSAVKKRSSRKGIDKIRFRCWRKPPALDIFLENMNKEPIYIPALRFRILTQLYDFVLRWLMQEQRFKRALVEAVNIQVGEHVLDLGCGTATLTIMIKQTYAHAQVTGVDGDTQVLNTARLKVRRAGVSLSLDEGMAYDLPYPDATFDQVVSSLMFHHLKTQEKQQSLNEVHRVLKLGGWLCIVDFGPPHGLWSRIISPVMAHLEEAGDNHKGKIPVMMQQAGFQEVAVTRKFSTAFGTLNLFTARKG